MRVVQLTWVCHDDDEKIEEEKVRKSDPPARALYIRLKPLSSELIGVLYEPNWRIALFFAL